METQRAKWLFRTDADGVLVPTTFLVRLLMLATVCIGLSQGGIAVLKAEVPALNAIAITMLPIIGGAMTLFIFIPMAVLLDKKTKNASTFLEAFFTATVSGFVFAVTVVGFTYLFAGSRKLGMPFHGLCQALLIPHWYHFVLVTVVGMTWPCHVLWVWARRSTKESNPENVVLQTR